MSSLLTYPRIPSKALPGSETLMAPQGSLDKASVGDMSQTPPSVQVSSRLLTHPAFALQEQVSSHRSGGGVEGCSVLFPLLTLYRARAHSPCSAE